MPQTVVAQRPRPLPGKRRYGPRNWTTLLATWRIEDIAKLRLFRANGGRRRRRGETRAFAESIGRPLARVKALLWCLPEKRCFASPSLIDDGPLTFAERMALIWEAERNMQRDDHRHHERKRVRNAPKRNNSKPPDEPEVEVTVEGPGKE